MKLTENAIGRGAVTLLLAATGSTLHAAENTAPATDSIGAISEVFVQARRTDESVQSVPLAVTALSADAIREASLSTAADLSRAIPSLQLSPSTGRRDTVTISMRSQVTAQTRLDTDMAVGVYFNEVVVARPYGLNQGLYDLASVQVLKGPQGTLFGRNTTGGAVLFQPNLPEIGQLAGSLELDVGNDENRIVTGVANIPVADTFALRAAGRVAHRNGYVKNVLDDSRLNDVDNYSFRLSALYQPTDRLESSFLYDEYQSDDNGTATRIAMFSNPAVVAAQQQRGPYKVALNGPHWSKATVRGVSNTTTYSADTITLKNILGWRRTELSAASDLDGSPVPVIDVFQDAGIKQWSDELQLQGSAFDDALDYIVGAYYFVEDGTDRTRVRLGGGTTDFTNGGPARNESKSIFTQGTYTFPSIPELQATAGVRYTWDKREVDLQPHLTANGLCIFNGPGALSVCNYHAAENFESPSWSIGLSYQWDQVLLYATSRRGYRSGGFNITSNSTAELLPAYEPEKVTDIELGMKSDWTIAGMPLRVNAAVYYAEGDDLQRNVFTAGSTTLRTVNAAKGTFRGFELEGIIKPLEGLTLNAFYNYDKGEYDEFMNGLVDVSDSKFPFTPPRKYGLGARYEFALPGALGGLAFDANYTYQGEMYIDALNRGGPESRVDDYELVNARLEWSNVQGAPFDIALYVRNVSDSEYVSGATRVVGLTSHQAGEPRQYGVQLRYRFGE